MKSISSSSSKSRKTLKQKFVFQIDTLNPHGINERFSFNLFILVPVVRRLDNAIQWICVNKTKTRYPVDSDLSSGQLYPAFEQPGPVVFHVARHQIIAQFHFSVYKPHTTRNSSIRSDEGLMLETSVSESLYGGQFT